MTTTKSELLNGWGNKLNYLMFIQIEIILKSCPKQIKSHRKAAFRKILMEKMVTNCLHLLPYLQLKVIHCVLSTLGNSVHSIPNPQPQCFMEKKISVSLLPETVYTRAELRALLNMMFFNKHW